MGGRYARRLERATAELDAAGIAPGGGRSPLWRLIRACRLPLRPPHYQGWIGTALHYLIVCVPLVWLFFWALVWRHDDARLSGQFSTSLQFAIVPAIALTLLTRLSARWHRLSDWRTLDDTGASTGDVPGSHPS